MKTRISGRYSLGTPVVAIMALGSLGTPALVGAQSATLEEIIVTAERRESNVQDTAAAISVRKGDELSAQGRLTTRQILEDVPGISALGDPSFIMPSSDVQGRDITIRGVSSPNAAPSSGVSIISAVPATAVYVDGVFEGIGGSYDIDRVEVLRGPQGTLYGRSATAGVVAFHTRNPTFDGVGIDASAELGNYDLRHYSAALNAPVSDTFAVRLAGDYRDQDEGYYGIARGFIRETTNGRIKALWQPNESFSLLMGVAAQQDNSHTGGTETIATPPGPAISTRETPVTPGGTESRQYWAEINWDFGPLTLTYQPAYRTWTQDDIVFAASDFIGSGADLYQFAQTPSDSFTTHELRLASNENSKFHWQTGAFYYDNKLKAINATWLYYPDGTQAGSLFASRDKRRTENLGIFGEGTMTFTDALSLTVGVRYDDTRITVNEAYTVNQNSFCGTALRAGDPACTGPGLPLDNTTFTLDNTKLTFHNFNYKVRLEYDLAPENMLYAMISTGFRPGDAGVSGSPPTTPLNAVRVEPEKLTAFEIGSKNRFLNDGLQANASVYFYRYRGFFTSYYPNTPSPCDPCNPSANVSASEPADSYGAELELLYQLTQRDRLGLNYSYAKSYWVDKDAAFAAAQPEHYRAIMPHLLTANYDHRFTLPGDSTFTARVDARYVPAYLTSNWNVDYLALGFDQYGETEDQTIFNLTGTWASSGGRYSVSGYVRNVFDEHQLANNGYSLPNVIDPIQGQYIFTRVGRTDPRTYGVMFSAHF